MSKEQWYWIIKRPQGDYYFNTLSPSKKDCISRFEEDDVGSWKRYYGRGFRCVRVSFIES